MQKSWALQVLEEQHDQMLHEFNAKIEAGAEIS